MVDPEDDLAPERAPIEDHDQLSASPDVPSDAPDPAPPAATPVTAGVAQPDGADVAAVAHAAAAETTPAGDAGSAQRARRAPVRRWLLADLDQQDAFLLRATRHFRTTSGEEALSHAAEWLLDNFYVAHQAVREIREDMPQGFYRQLPLLVDGPLAGYPRVYDIAQRLVSMSEARLDLEYTRQFLVYYQDELPLTTGELWALPVMLRLSLLIMLARTLSAITGLPEPPAPPALPLAGAWTHDELVGNCFTGLRTLATHDWRRFFEAVSRVEATLRGDPAGIYGRMDRETRDHYRKAVEQIALASGLAEQAVAAQAVALARGTLAPDEEADRQLEPPTAEPREEPAQGVDWLARPESHVGYFLIDAGRPKLEAALGRRDTAWRRAAAELRRHATPLYLGPILFLAGLLVLAALAFGRHAAATPWEQLLIFILTIVPGLTVAVSLVDWLVTLRVPPHVLPKLDFDAGIPDDFRTLVAVPSLLTSSAEIQGLLEQLEIYYLGNPDRNLAFALLTDLTDADEREKPEDRALLERVREGIRNLNARHDRVSGPPFYLFHRERRWNPSQGHWIGWERKRGKLHELNRWLRGAQDTSLCDVRGRPAMRWTRCGTSSPWTPTRSFPGTPRNVWWRLWHTR